MRNILILLLIVTTISCEFGDKKTDTNKTKTTVVKSDFDWLIGKWKRNNEEEGKETFENWNKVSSSEYYGIGFTMQNGDTIKQERMKITKHNSKWNLAVKTPEESEYIIFELTDLQEDSFAFKNDSIDFPNLIKYWKNKDKINASVAGGDFKIEFQFERIK